MLHKPVRCYEQGQKPGSNDKIKLIYDKKGRTALEPMRRLKNAATISPSIAPRERPRRMNSCS